jgi:hypothetical protein
VGFEQLVVSNRGRAEHRVGGRKVVISTGESVGGTGTAPQTQDIGPWTTFPLPSSFSSIAPSLQHASTLPFSTCTLNRGQKGGRAQVLTAAEYHLSPSGGRLQPCRCLPPPFRALGARHQSCRAQCYTDGASPLRSPCTWRRREAAFGGAACAPGSRTRLRRSRR